MRLWYTPRNLAQALVYTQGLGTHNNIILLSLQHFLLLQGMQQGRGGRREGKERIRRGGEEEVTFRVSDSKNAKKKIARTHV